jgi:two-component system response regulator (stage 0 sporulation protein F)
VSAESINVLINDSAWAWPQAVREVFSSRGVELMLVKKADQALDVLQHRRIHTAIVDMESQMLNGLAIIRMIRPSHPLLPCILLSSSAEQKLLSEALELNVFSVINKPVNIEILRSQLNRLFIKKYDSKLFEENNTKKVF